MSDEEPRPEPELQIDEPAAALPESDEHPAPDRRRPVADWGGDELFNHMPRRRFTRSGVGSHSRRPSPSPITSHQLRRNLDVAAGAAPRGVESHAASEPGASTLISLNAALEPSLVALYEPDARGGEAQERREDFYAGRERRRERRSVDQRVGPRPDRIAALAFMLGMLLVLVAVATADAAALAAF